jgi:predicted dehydrogenase
MARERLTYGVLGVGSIGRRHHKNLQALGQEVFYYDPIHAGPEVRDRVLKRCDAILVCTPTKRHAEDFMDAANAGKHVFVEKPFGYDCPPLLDGFLRGTRSRFPKQVIATGFNLRFHDCVTQAKNKINTLGDILKAKFHVLQKTEKPTYLMDGIIRNWCSHELDLAMYLIGLSLEVVDCYATHDAQGRDTIDATIKLKRGALEVYIEADYNTDPQRRFFWIQGTKGTMYVDLEARELTIDYIGQPLPFVYKAEDSWDKNYMSEMMAFVRACTAGVQSSIHTDDMIWPMASGEQGVHNLYAIMKARELARVND